MAITFTFVWTLATTAGFQSNFKYAIFLQSIGLLAILPYIMVKARVIRLADLRVLLWSLPPSIALGFVGTAAGKRMNLRALTMNFLLSGVVMSRQHLFVKSRRMRLVRARKEINVPTFDSLFYQTVKHGFVKEMGKEMGNALRPQESN